MTLRYLFVDMNSYFASVEQLLRPELRGLPIAVVPVRAETTCCIAASYEAKRFGVKTGTPVWQARQLCPRLRVIQARPELYIQTHHRFLAAIDSVTPILQVRSIDELVCRLTGVEQQPAGAIRLAQQIKRALADQVGPTLRCSIGVAPNQLLAKVASDMQKPDGLTVIQQHELPQRLWPLKLRDLPGIGARMEQRLNRAGLQTMQQLTELSASQLSQAWGSRVHGTGWWHALRGDDIEPPPTRRRSLGHSHVLPPDLRNPAGARMVLYQLVHKAAARLRKEGYFARELTLTCKFTDHSHDWSGCDRFPATENTLTFLRSFQQLWNERPRGIPLHVGVVLGQLQPQSQVAASLFPEDQRQSRLSHALDEINQRFGARSVQFGGLASDGNQTPVRIAFTCIPDLDEDD